MGKASLTGRSTIPKRAIRTPGDFSMNAAVAVRRLPQGIQVTKLEIQAISVTRPEFHDELNCLYRLTNTRSDG